MSINGVNLILNAKNANEIYKGVLQSYGMRVTNSFVPVAPTEHILQSAKNKRYRLIISENTFTEILETKVGDEWCSNRKSSRTMTGSIKKVEDEFIKTIKRLTSKKQIKP